MAAFQPFVTFRNPIPALHKICPTGTAEAPLTPRRNTWPGPKPESTARATQPVIRTGFQLETFNRAGPSQLSSQCHVGLETWHSPMTPSRTLRVGPTRLRASDCFVRSRWRPVQAAAARLPGNPSGTLRYMISESCMISYNLDITVTDDT
jgi:hypothetical protein